MTKKAEKDIVLIHDHDKDGLDALLGRGGRVVGWVDGFYKVFFSAKNQKKEVKWS